MAVFKNTVTSSRLDTATVFNTGNDFITLSVAEFDTVGVQVGNGLTGTVSYTASIDGTNFFPISGPTVNAGASANNDVNPSGIVRQFDVRAVVFLRVQATTVTSGTTTVSWYFD